MTEPVEINGRLVGPGQPTYVIGEIGINHNGDVEIAKKLVDAARLAGCDAVKLQKRVPDLAVPQNQRDVPRETPWGVMSYLEYKKRIEFGEIEIRDFDEYCQAQGMIWFSSCWDVPSVDVMEQFSPPAYKIASATLTNHDVIDTCVATGKPVILSTGMSTMEEIRAAARRVPVGQLLIAHSTSTYPCRPEELNLRMIQTLAEEFSVPIGYSGHEVGLQTSVAAVVLGATFVERHITLDRAMWGTDQSASVEPSGLMRLVRDIRVTEEALGDGRKRVYESELPILAKLRGRA